MIPAPLPPDEPARLAALHRTGVLDTPPEPEFDDLVRLASRLCEVPIAAVSLIDAGRQWFKARVGVDCDEAPRDMAFCGYAILQTGPLVVPDTSTDDRFADHPLVTGDPPIRFYAGVPLADPDGHNLGALCVADRVPRQLTADQQEVLAALARQAATLLTLRRQIAERERAEAQLRQSKAWFRGFMDHLPVNAWAHGPDEKVVFANRQFATRHRRSEDELAGFDLFATLPADLVPLYRASDRQVRETGRVYQEVEPVVRADGSRGEFLVIKFPLADGAGRACVGGLSIDLTPQRQAEAAGRASEERFRAFMDHSPAMAFMKDEAGRYVYVNEPACVRFGLPRASWLGKTDADLWPAEVAAPLRAVDERVLAAGGPVRLTETLPTPDGRSRYWQTDKFRFTDPAGRQFLAGMAVDVTAEQAAADALRESEERFRAVVQTLAEGVVLLDPDTRRVLQANAAFCDLLGYTPGELAGLTQYDFATHDPADADAHLRMVLDRGRCLFGERKYRRKDGTRLDAEVSGSVVQVGGRAVVSLVVRDVTERRRFEDRLIAYQRELEQANARLAAAAVTDGLTGVPNRAALDDRLAETVGRAVRAGRPLSVLMIDVDRFKAYNDTFGHTAGDAALRQVAGLLQQAARATDLVARYGGEEFAVVLPDTDHTGALVVAERLRRAVAGAAWRHRPVTISVGAATTGPGQADGRALLRAADEALYRSKLDGRNRVSHGSGPVKFPAPAGSSAG